MQGKQQRVQTEETAMNNMNALSPDQELPYIFAKKSRFPGQIVTSATTIRLS